MNAGIIIPEYDWGEPEYFNLGQMGFGGIGPA
jgi:hypothetical protein